MTFEILLEFVALAGLVQVAWGVRADVGAISAKLSHIERSLQDHEDRIRSLENDPR